MTEPLWMTEVRLRAQRRVLWCRELWGRNRYVGEEGLAITHSEVERALTSPIELLAQEQRFYREDQEAAALSKQLKAISRHKRSDADERWRRLLKLFDLSAAEAPLLACTLAAEAQPSLRRVFGYLEDSVTALHPSPEIAARLWGWPIAPILGSHSQLRRWRLAAPLAEGHEAQSGSTPWTADPLVLRYLIGDQGAGRGLAGATLAAPKLALFEREQTQIVALAKALGQDGTVAVEAELTGPTGVGKATLAAQVAAELGRELVAVDCAQIAGESDPASAAVRELREALLRDALVHWRHAELLDESTRIAISGLTSLSFLGTKEPLRPTPVAGVLRRTSRLRALDQSGRLALWAAIGAGPAPEPVREWALGAREVVAATQAAAIGEAAVREICAGLLLETPSDLITPLAQPYTWEDLVAPPQLREHLHELEEQARSRTEVLDGWGLGRLAPLGRGVSAMFAGPSGTGKTMAAQVLARELGLQLLRVDLAGVVNKYIGETEKHLRAVFAACERAPVMLFFDEADALFGRRMQVSDAHDRFANIEVDYLLQRMEEFDGIAVLATNRKGDIDTAFMRRLRFVIDFAPPTISERELIWRAALEDRRDGDGTLLADELDWLALATDLDLTGAGIKASALAAAFLARSDGSRITARHIVTAARRELEKQGVIVRVGQLERAGALDPDRARGVGTLSAGEIEQMVNGALA